MHMQQSAMNDGQLLFGQATLLINISSCNFCPSFAQSLPAAPGFAIPLCRAASCTSSGDARASELQSISSAFRINCYAIDVSTLITAGADKTVPSRANETSGDRAPRLRKSDKVVGTLRSLKHMFTGQGSDLIIAISIGSSTCIDTESIALSRPSSKGPIHTELCCHEICNTGPYQSCLSKWSSQASCKQLIAVTVVPRNLVLRRLGAFYLDLKRLSLGVLQHFAGAH
jgi:hypothetical protein